MGLRMPFGSKDKSSNNKSSQAAQELKNAKKSVDKFTEVIKQARADIENSKKTQVQILLGTIDDISNLSNSITVLDSAISTITKGITKINVKLKFQIKLVKVLASSVTKNINSMVDSIRLIFEQVEQSLKPLTTPQYITKLIESKGKDGEYILTETKEAIKGTSLVERLLRSMSSVLQSLSFVQSSINTIYKSVNRIAADLLLKKPTFEAKCNFITKTFSSIVKLLSGSVFKLPDIIDSIVGNIDFKKIDAIKLKIENSFDKICELVTIIGSKVHKIFKQSFKILAKITLLLVSVIATVTVVVAAALKLFSILVSINVNWAKALIGMLAMAVSLSIVILAIRALAKLSKNSIKDMAVASLTIMAAAATLTLMVASLLMIDILIAGIKDLGKLTLRILAVVGIFSLLFISFTVLGLAATFVWPFLLIMLGISVLLSGTILMMVGTLKMIDSIEFSDDLSEKAYNLGQAYTSLIDGMPSVKSLLKAMIKLPMMTAIAFAVIPLAVGAKMISAISKNINFEELGNNIGNLVCSILSPMMRIANGEIIENGEWVSRPDLKKMFSGISFASSPIGRVIKASKKLGKVIGNLATGVANMASLKIPLYDDKGKIIGYRSLSDADFENAGKNTAKIITTIIGDENNGLLSLLNEDNYKELFTSGMFVSTSPVGRVINTSIKLGNLISELATGVANMASLKIPLYDDKGKIIGYRSLSDADFENAGRNTAKIITTIIGDENNGLLSLASSPVFIEASDRSWWDFGEDNSSPLHNVISTSLNISKIIGDIASGVVQMATLKFKDSAGKTVTLTQEQIIAAGTNTANILRAVIGDDENGLLSIQKEAGKLIKDKSFLKGINNISDIVVKLTDPISKLTTANAGAYKSIVSETGKLAASINSIDSTKLEKSASMMTAMADISKNISSSLDKFTETLNKDLIEVLERIEDALTKINDTNINIKTNTVTSNNNTIPVSSPASTTPVQQDNSFIEDLRKDIAKVTSAIDSIRSTGLQISQKDPFVPFTVKVQ